MTTPLFKTLSDAALRIEYKAWRELAYNNANMAASGAVNVKKAAFQMGQVMKNVQIIEAIAKKRGISLVAPTCPVCKFTECECHPFDNVD